MTTQELFDKVTAHLLTQNQASTDDDGECRYRSPDGLMCAIGCLIDDDHYSDDFEGIPIGSMTRSSTPFLKGRVVRAVEESLGIELTKEQIVMLGWLQDIHDSHEVDRWPESFAKVASHYKLVRI